MDDLIKKKIVLIGDAAVGKSSLVSRFVKGFFDDKYIATIGTNVSKKAVTLHDYVHKKDINIDMMIWDILGQEGFDRVKKTAYQGSEGAIVVCDLTRSETVHHVRNWIKHFKEIVNEAPIIILGNKIDLVEGDHPNIFLLEGIGKELNIQHYLTSAKSGDNVNESFYLIAETLYLSLAKPIPNLTPPGVMDVIFDTFCTLHGDQERAMPIIQKVFEDQKLDFLKMDVPSLRKFVEALVQVDWSQLGKGAVREKEIYLKLIDELERQEKERGGTFQGEKIDEQSVKSFSTYVKDVIQKDGTFDIYKGWIGRTT
jgi:small GTP-binding protein